jgi:Reverse transcriptase (RNA-dependent DNA polymerase)
MDKKNRVGLLSKALYCLKQAPLVLSDTFLSVLIREGFERCDQEPCIFVKNFYGANNFGIVSVYVDDIVAATTSCEITKSIVSMLTTNF